MARLVGRVSGSGGLEGASLEAALSRAARRRDTQTCRLLVTAGVPLTADAICQAAEAGSADTLSLLLHGVGGLLQLLEHGGGGGWGGQCGRRLEAALFRAMKAGNAELWQLLLAAGVPPQRGTLAPSWRPSWCSTRAPPSAVPRLTSPWRKAASA